MEDIKKVFTIQWVGPFTNLETMNKYLNSEDTCDNTLFSFYFFCGNRSGKGHKISKYYSYFGIHCPSGKKSSSISTRLNKKHEHYRHFIENKNMRIWLGSFSNEDYQEKSNIEYVETAFISTYHNKKTGILTENVKKTKSWLNESICIINLFYKHNQETRWKVKKTEIAFIDDVLIFEHDQKSYYSGNLRKRYSGKYVP
ncbi:MAG: hypothetical protein PHS38_12460 [Bacteroidales bacterium]|nr:hypothetical protein [Paludibacter sp.]MDD3945509.1 hypothetical protein [Bacteroidales bacterium]